MIGTPHRIGELRFELAVADVSSPLADGAVLAARVREALLGAVEKACDGARRPLRVERLALDLGTIPEPVDWPALRVSLAARLSAALAAADEAESGAYIDRGSAGSFSALSAAEARPLPAGLSLRLRRVAQADPRLAELIAAALARRPGPAGNRVFDPSRRGAPAHHQSAEDAGAPEPRDGAAVQTVSGWMAGSGSPEPPRANGRAEGNWPPGLLAGVLADLIAGGAGPDLSALVAAQAGAPRASAPASLIQELFQAGDTSASTPMQLQLEVGRGAAAGGEPSRLDDRTQTAHTETRDPPHGAGSRARLDRPGPDAPRNGEPPVGGRLVSNEADRIAGAGVTDERVSTHTRGMVPGQIARDKQDAPRRASKSDLVDRARAGDIPATADILRELDAQPIAVAAVPAAPAGRGGAWEGGVAFEAMPGREPLTPAAPGAALLQLWRDDPALFESDVDGRGGEELLRLLAAVLAGTASEAESALVRAATQAARQGVDGAAVLRRILAAIVAGYAADLEAESAGQDRPDAMRMERGSATSGSLPSDTPAGRITSQGRFDLLSGAGAGDSLYDSAGNASTADVSPRPSESASWAQRLRHPHRQTGTREDSAGDEGRSDLRSEARERDAGDRLGSSAGNGGAADAPPRLTASGGPPDRPLRHSHHSTGTQEGRAREGRSDLPSETPGPDGEGRLDDSAGNGPAADLSPQTSAVASWDPSRPHPRRSTGPGDTESQPAPHRAHGAAENVRPADLSPQRSRVASWGPSPPHPSRLTGAGDNEPQPAPHQADGVAAPVRGAFTNTSTTDASAARSGGDNQGSQRVKPADAEADLVGDVEALVAFLITGSVPSREDRAAAAAARPADPPSIARGNSAAEERAEMPPSGSVGEAEHPSSHNRGTCRYPLPAARDGRRTPEEYANQHRPGATEARMSERLAALRRVLERLAAGSPITAASAPHHPEPRGEDGQADVPGAVFTPSAAPGGQPYHTSMPAAAATRRPPSGVNAAEGTASSQPPRSDRPEAASRPPAGAGTAGALDGADREAHGNALAGGLRGAALLASWRSDRPAFEALAKRADTAALVGYLEAAIAADGAEPPLFTACRAAAARSTAPQDLLRAVLTHIVDDAVIDLEALSRAHGERSPTETITAADETAWDRIAAACRGDSAPQDAREVIAWAVDADPERLAAVLIEAKPQDAGTHFGSNAENLQRGPDPDEPHGRARLLGHPGAGGGERGAAPAARPGSISGERPRASHPHSIQPVNGPAERQGHHLPPGGTAEPARQEPAAPGGDRLARFAATAGPELCIRLLERVAPGTLPWGRATLALLGEALPPEADADLWAALLGETLGPGKPSVAGLMRRIVDRAAGSDSPNLTADILAERIAAASGRHSPAAVAQVLGSLRALAGDAPAAAAEELLLTRASGLVLVAPYLGMLFDRLGVTEDGALAGQEAADRALDVLHAILHGAAEVSPGGRALERLLLGLPPDARPRPPLPIEPEAAALVDGMLAAVIARWGALGKTSVDGLREAFLRRDGLLRRTESGWSLEVSSKSYDMLLDRLPWGIAVVKLRWMPAPLHIKWRN